MHRIVEAAGVFDGDLPFVLLDERVEAHRQLGRARRPGDEAEPVEGFIGKRNGQRRGVVGPLVAELPGIPGGVEQREVDHAHVAPDAFDFLQIPQRVGVVVAFGEEDGVFVEAHQHVVGEVARQVAPGSVVVVVVLDEHPAGDGQKQQHTEDPRHF